MENSDTPTHLWLRFKRHADPRAHAALCALYDPLRLHTAEKMQVAGLLDRRVPADDYAETALPALLTAINLYDPERRGHDGKPLNPRNWVILCLRQAMRAHSERETKRLNILAPVQVIDLADGPEALVDLVADPAGDMLERANLSAALSRLPYLQREAIRGVYVEGLKAEEVAGRLKIKATAMRRHVLPRAKRRLAWHLRNQGGGPNDYAKMKKKRAKRYTEVVTYRDTPEGYADLIRLAEARGVSVPEVLRQLKREAVRSADLMESCSGQAQAGGYHPG